MSGPVAGGDEAPGEQLRALAQAVGLTLEYWDWQGRQVGVSAGTVRGVLAGLGIDASTPRAVQEALSAHELEPWRSMLAPIVVVREDDPVEISVHVDHGAPVRVWIILEDGSERHDVEPVDRWVEPRQVDDRLVGRATVRLPAGLPLGWHRLHATSGDRSATGLLVVTPDRVDVAVASAGDRLWGLQVQLYQVRSRGSWGLGDLRDLRTLAEWAGRRLGADFVLVNPLHAAEPVPPITDSPYLPTSRRYVNPLYLRVEDVPEYAGLSAADRVAVQELAEPLRAQLRADVLLDRDRAWTAKRAALEIVRRVPLSPGRAASLARYLAAEGEGLQRYATWCALAETYGPAWRDWPEQLHDPDGPAVRLARTELADLVDLHGWLQWLLEEQLVAAQAAATGCGMRIGIIHDLAVGVHPEGADSWAQREVLAVGCTAGAPPDPFNQLGQDWSQPPFHPHRLAASGYAAFRDLVRAALRHAGGLRVDHVSGLFRLWWVPEAAAAGNGAYVGYDHEALVGILALEAQRAGALVVGEDLGVVEPWVRTYLEQRGLLGTSVVWFEKGWSGEPLAPEHWREACLATATTHDLPPTAGYLRGEHLAIRERLGLLTRPLEEERAADAAEQEAMRCALRSAGLLASDPGLDADGAGGTEEVVALHAWLGRTPCRLVGVALADLVGDRRAVNQPGTDREYPNWRVPLADGDGALVVLDDLVAPGGRDSQLAERLAAVCARRPAQ